MENKKIGYVWYVKMAYGRYMPEEVLYPTIEELRAYQQAHYPYYYDACIGIDKVEDDGSWFETIESIQKPTKCFFVHDSVDD